MEKNIAQPMYDRMAKEAKKEGLNFNLNNIYIINKIDLSTHLLI